jgi:hypothetical protein
MKTIKKIITTALLLLIASCSNGEMNDKLIPKEESQFAKIYLQKLQSKDFDYVKRYIDKSEEKKISDQAIHKLASYFPSGQLISTELIGSQVYIFNSQWKGSFTFEYHYSDGWALAEVTLKKSGDALFATGFSVYRTQASQKDLNKFTLIGRSALQYFVLAIGVISLVFILITTYFCVRTPIPKRKWLWILFILVGVGSISVNWTTGQFSLRLFFIKFLSFSAMAPGPFAPWIISASIPVGAILFWIKREKFIRMSLTTDANQVVAQSDVS